MIELASAAIFISLFLMAYLAGNFFTGIATAPPKGEIDLFVEPVFGNLTEPLAFAIPSRKKFLDDLSKDLLAAGKYHRNALINFMSTRNAVLFAATILTALLISCGFVPEFEIYVVGFAMVLVALIYSMPRIVIAELARNRKKKIEKSIPDALDLVALAVAGGLPISEALQRVNQEIADSFPALSRELKIICNQTRTGSVEVAFEKFAERIQIPEIAAWATLMQQSNRLGGGIAEALQDYANRIREDRNLRLEHSGNTASIKMLLPVVLCICPPILIMLVGPALLDVRDFLVRESNSPSAAIAEFNAAREQSMEVSAALRDN